MHAGSCRNSIAPRMARCKLWVQLLPLVSHWSLWNSLSKTVSHRSRRPLLHTVGIHSHQQAWSKCHKWTLCSFTWSLLTLVLCWSEECKAIENIVKSIPLVHLSFESERCAIFQRKMTSLGVALWQTDRWYLYDWSSTLSNHVTSAREVLVHHRGSRNMTRPLRLCWNLEVKTKAALTSTLSVFLSKLVYQWNRWNSSVYFSYFLAFSHAGDWVLFHEASQLLIAFSPLKLIN